MVPTNLKNITNGDQRRAKRMQATASGKRVMTCRREIQGVTAGFETTGIIKTHIGLSAETRPLKKTTTGRSCSPPILWHPIARNGITRWRTLARPSPSIFDRAWSRANQPPKCSVGRWQGSTVYWTPPLGPGPRQVCASSTRAP